MAESVFSVDVDDSRFKEFVALFQSHQAQVRQMKDLWSQVGTAAGKAAEASEEAAEATASAASSADTLDKRFRAAVVNMEGAQEATEGVAAASATAAEMWQIAATQASLLLQGMEKVEKAVESIGDRTKDTADNLERSVKPSLELGEGLRKGASGAMAIAGSIAEATRDLAKWATFSLGAGLVGGGAGLFGLDALAGSIGQSRYSAQGLGITIGEQKAFDLNFGSRLVGSGFLQGVQNLQTNLGNQWMFGAMGLPQGEAENDDTAQLGVAIIKRAHALWQQFRGAPPAELQTLLQTHGLAGVMDVPTWRRIGQASDAQLAAYEKQYAQDAQATNISDPTAQIWQNFGIQLKRAWAEIESDIATGLKPLMGPLSDLSQDVAKSVAIFIQNPNLGKWIDEAGAALERFATYLGTPKFEQDVEDFAADIAQLADSIARALRYLGLIPASSSQGTGSVPDTAVYGGHGAAPGGYAGGRPAGMLSSGLPIEGDAADPRLPAATTAYGVLGNAGIGSYSFGTSYDFRGMQQHYGLPASLWSAVALQESGGRAHPPDSVVKGQHYQGMFQMGAAMQQQYGVTNPYDPDQEANAFGMVMINYLNQYHDIRKALAAYNWGPQALQNDIDQYGSDWLAHAPAQTQQYIASVIPQLPGSFVSGYTSGTNVGAAADAMSPGSVTQTAPGGSPNTSTVTGSAPSGGRVRVDVNLRITNQTGAQTAVIANATRQ
jgi:hypothetical protein